MNFYDFEAIKIDGQPISMEAYKDKVVLVVNTASKCGFTPQFEGLEALYKEYKEKGLDILGFPCNQFARQDPKSNADIYGFCTINYGVTFGMFEKIEVNGDKTHPLYKFLKKQKTGLLGSGIKWNFTKFLINKHGEVIERFAPQVKPEKLKPEIEKLL